MRELIARVKVLFRRTALRSKKPEDRDIIRHGPLELDIMRVTLQWKGTAVPLTVTEFRILQALVEQPGYVKTRRRPMEQAYPHDGFMSDRTIDCHIKRLRKKITRVDPDFSGIETIYGLGYRYAPE